jgi:hypothetical protein
MAGEGPDAIFASRYVAGQSRRVQPSDDVRSCRQLVPVTTWVHPDLLGAAQPYHAPGRVAPGTRSPYALGGLAVAVAVAATLAICVAIALLALVAWVTAHALAVGVGLAALVASALVCLLALARARNAGPPAGGCCR